MGRYIVRAVDVMGWVLLGNMFLEESLACLH